MLMRLRRALLTSAAGRCLAIDLAEVHGDDAMEVLDAMIDMETHDLDRRDILLKARDVLANIEYGDRPSR